MKQELKTTKRYPIYFLKKKYAQWPEPSTITYYAMIQWPAYLFFKILMKLTFKKGSYRFGGSHSKTLMPTNPITQALCWSIYNSPIAHWFYPFRYGGTE